MIDVKYEDIDLIMLSKLSHWLFSYLSFEQNALTVLGWRLQRNLSIEKEEFNKQKIPFFVHEIDMCTCKQ